MALTLRIQVGFDVVADKRFPNDKVIGIGPIDLVTPEHLVKPVVVENDGAPLIKGWGQSAEFHVGRSVRRTSDPV